MCANTIYARETLFHLISIRMNYLRQNYVPFVRHTSACTSLQFNAQMEF